MKRKPRSPDESERIYGTPEHGAWMRAQPCAICGVVGYSVVAHVRNGGMSKKADWRQTIPLCQNVRVYGVTSSAFYILPGCHHKFDTHKKSFRAKHDTDALALFYAARWLSIASPSTQ